MSEVPQWPQCRRPLGRRSQSEMVRFSNDSSSSGDDEVDNVQSKPLKDPSVSPSPSHTKQGREKSSLTNVVNGVYPTDGTPPFSSFYEYVNESLDRSESSERHQNSPAKEILRNEGNKSTPTKEGIKSSNILYYLIIIAAVLVGIFMNYFYYNNTSEHIQFSQDLMSLKKKYVINDDSILQVQSGIRTIFDKGNTGAFTFVYNSDSKDFNLTQFENFVNEVALVSAKYLRKTDSSNGKDTREIRHTVLMGSNIVFNTHGEFINKYKEDLKQTGVMLVKELGTVPPNMAMAFHYYCDEYTPLAKRSAIFFTMDLGKCSNNYEKKTYAFIENCLKSKWRSVPRDNIGPLLTRVVDIVIDIYSIFQ